MVGPGLVVAATGVGAADLVATLVAGAKFGYTLLWVAVLGAVIKVVLVEGAGRFSLASGRTIFEGWRSIGRWTTWYFAPYIVVWGLVYGATAMSSSALPVVAIFPDLSLRWTAVAFGLVGLAMVWFGSYATFERITVALVGVMFVTIVGAAAVTAPNLGEIVLGLRPILPDDSLDQHPRPRRWCRRHDHARGVRLLVAREGLVDAALHEGHADRQLGRVRRDRDLRRGDADRRRRALLLRQHRGGDR